MRDSGLEGTRDIYRVSKEALDIYYAGWLYRIGFELQESFNYLIERMQA